MTVPEPFSRLLHRSSSNNSNASGQKTLAAPSVLKHIKQQSSSSNNSTSNNNSSPNKNRSSGKRQETGSSSSSKSTSQTDSSNSLKALKAKKAMEIAIAPGKSILMTLFMLYMAGSGVQIFSILITGMTMMNPIKGILALNSVFSQFSGSSSRQKPFLDSEKQKASPETEVSATATDNLDDQIAADKLLLAKVIYIACHLLTFCCGLYKLSTMGLLPTTSSDWLYLVSPKEVRFRHTSWKKLLVEFEKNKTYRPRILHKGVLVLQMERESVVEDDLLPPNVSELLSHLIFDKDEQVTFKHLLAKSPLPMTSAQQAQRWLSIFYQKFKFELSAFVVVAKPVKNGVAVTLQMIENSSSGEPSSKQETLESSGEDSKPAATIDSNMTFWSLQKAKPTSVPLAKALNAASPEVLNSVEPAIKVLDIPVVQRMKRESTIVIPSTQKSSSQTSNLTSTQIFKKETPPKPAAKSSTSPVKPVETKLTEPKKQVVPEVKKQVPEPKKNAKVASKKVDSFAAFKKSSDTSGSEKKQQASNSKKRIIESDSEPDDTDEEERDKRLARSTAMAPIDKEDEEEEEADEEADEELAKLMMEDEPSQTELVNKDSDDKTPTISESYKEAAERVASPDMTQITEESSAEKEAPKMVVKRKAVKQKVAHSYEDENGYLITELKTETVYQEFLEPETVVTPSQTKLGDRKRAALSDSNSMPEDKYSSDMSTSNNNNNGKSAKKGKKASASQKSNSSQSSILSFFKKT